jgi:c-di-GMP-binding flagellar brake protein YcgR
MAERRKYQRIPFSADAEIKCRQKKYHGELLDISLLGALVKGGEEIPFEKGDVCELLIHLLESTITMQFDVDLVHRDENKFGFRFVGEDTETMTHLRRLLELNLGSSDAIDKEVSLWLKDE